MKTIPLLTIARWLFLAASLVACAEFVPTAETEAARQVPVTEETAETAALPPATSENAKDEDDVGGFDIDRPVARTEELVFAPGETEKVIGGGTVAAGSLHEYLFTAPAGQQLTVELQVEENNAAFQVQDRISIESESFWSNTLSPYPAIAARRWSGMLPKSDGEQFRILVGSTDDRDASYLMRVVRE